MHALTIFLPLIGCLIAGLFGRQIGDRQAQLVTTIAMLASALLSCVILYQVAFQGVWITVDLFTWIDSGSLEVSWALKFDTLSAVMVFVVCSVSSMIHVYSIGYMAHDPSIPRFFSYLSLFTFAMLMLVTADNLVQMFFGWEGVGLASYLLIGFWYERPSANAAAMKAFIVNRVGDFGFLLGILGVYFVFGSIDFDTIFAAAPEVAGRTLNFLGMELDLLSTLCLLLFVGAMGKSAQLGLHTWLPDAMEGPTPVSALIHAATMVTAGVFLVVRCSPLFEYAPAALAFVTIIGASTAFFAATVALTQNDIKRVVAYSTCSQLGYMFFAAGVGAYAAAIFHLMTHAFFKALLFLGSGSVIHAMDDEQDMRRMGGLASKLPLTALLMWIGCLSLAGIPLFAGYYSKDIILEAAFASDSPVAQYAFWLGLAGVPMTAFYSWRLLLMTFHGKTRADEQVFAHAHEAPWTMTVPNIVLAVGAIIAGWLAQDYFVGDGMDAFWGASILTLAEENVLVAAHHVPSWVPMAPTIAAAVGIFVAFTLYMWLPRWPAAITRAFNGPYQFLLNKWYFDELYDRMIVQPCFVIGRGLWKSGDGAVIDGVGPDGVAAAARDLSVRVGRLQSGYLYHYAFAMLIGVVALVTWYMLRAS